MLLLTDSRPTIVVIVGYIGSFYLLSLTLQSLPIGLVYATWSGVGIIGASVIGLVFFDESVDVMAVIGMTLIVVGVVVLNLFSESYAPAH